ncbi:hypothetical protein [Streptomyces sp. B1-3]|uniref:hypothetical protein n=1 Tax=Streptomyces sp. B1-3 TaxID=3141453 RepID=UPI003D296744
MRHVHLGAGALGLGLVAQLTAAQGVDVSVVQRSVGRSTERLASLVEHRGYWRVIASNNLPPDRWPSNRVAITKAFALESEDELKREICDPECRLLTISLGEGGLEAQVPLISTILQERAAQNSGRGLCVIACENTIGEEYAKLSQQRFPEVTFVPCLVDRMCSSPGIAPDGQVRVDTEDFGSWVIQRIDGATEFIESSFGSDGDIEFVDDLPLRRKQKRWLMNGPHLTAGIFAWNAGISRIDYYLDGENASIFRAVQREYIEAFHSSNPSVGLEELRSYSREVLRRISAFPMPTSKVLRRLRPDKLEELLRTGNEIIVKPSSEYLKRHHHQPVMLTLGIHTLIDLVDSREYVEL